MWRLPLFTSVEIEIKQRGSPGKLPLRLKTCIQSCVFTALYENQSGCTVTFAKRTDCWSTNCDQGFWDIVFQGQPTKASGMGFGHFPQNNRSTAVNSNLYGSLLLLCFFENINNDNPFIELLAMCQVHSNHFVLLYLILIMGFTGGSDGKESACNVFWVQSLGWEDPLEEGMAAHSSVLAWRIPMDRGAWRATVRRVTESQTQLSD